MDEETRISPISALRSDRFVHFDPYCFDRVGGLLLKDGIEVALPPRAARLLGCLLEDPGNLVPKDVLITAVWNGVAVSDQSLAEATSQLRHALEDDPSDPKYVQTVHRRGYRFLGPVTLEPHDLHADGSSAVYDRAVDVIPGAPAPTSALTTIQWTKVLFAMAAVAILVVGGAFLVREWLAVGADRAEQGFIDQLQETQQDLADLEDELRAIIRQTARSAFGSNPTVEIVWRQASITAYGASPSPSGEYISFGGAGSAPSLYRIDTHDTISLTKEEDPPSGWVATSPVFSPDSRHVAYVLQDEMGVEEPELRAVGIDGGEPVTLQRGAIANPHAWDPDGRHLIATRRRGSDLEIVHVSVEDGSSTILQTLSGYGRRRPARLALSPDGNSLAYDAWQGDGSGKRDIYVLSLDDGVELPVVQHAANDLFPMWTPDGTGLLFVSDRRDNYAAWVVRIRDREVEGPADLILPGGSSMIWPLGLSRDGSLFYGVGSGAPGGSDLYIAALEPRTLRATGTPVKALPAYAGLNLNPTWSPDGTQVAYVSQRGLLFEQDTVIVVSSVTGNQARKVLEIEPGLRYMRNLQWSPDGLSILALGYDDRMVWALYQIDVATGEAAPIVQEETPGVETIRKRVRWLPDGTGIVYGRLYREPMDDPATGETRNTGVQTLMLHELDGDLDRELHRNVQPYMRESWDLSPDGKYLAVSLYVPEDDSHKVVLQLIPLAGGPPEELMSVSSPFTIQYLAWAPGGERILFVRGEGDPQIWAVSLETGEAEPIGISLPWTRNMAFDPGGARIAFVASTQAPSGEVWVLRNFLPGPSVTGDKGGPASPRPSRR